jgi:ATP-binding cassette subfamily F protein 3
VTVEVLSEALADWEGALLLVSHDRWMVERVATHVLHVRPDGLSLKAGVEDADFEPVAAARRGASGPSVEGADDHQERKRKQRERERARKRADRIGEDIEAAEAAARQIEEEMFNAGADAARMRALVDAQRAADAKVAALYAEWEALEAALEAD